MIYVFEPTDWLFMTVRTAVLLLSLLLAWRAVTQRRFTLILGSLAMVGYFGYPIVTGQLLWFPGEAELTLANAAMVVVILHLLDFLRRPPGRRGGR